MRRGKLVRSWVTLVAVGLAAPLGARAAEYKLPPNKVIEESNVRLNVAGFAFGGGIAAKNANGQPKCNGLEVVEQSWKGSGFVALPDGTIVTNFHVANRALRMEAVFESGAKFDVKFIKAYDSGADIAVLGIAGKPGFMPVKLGNSDSVDRLDPVLAVGNPMGQGLNFSRGEVSQIVKDDYGKATMIRHTAPMTGGNSGGALYRGGEVVGVNESVLLGSAGGQAGFGMAVPINVVKAMLSTAQGRQLTDVFSLEKIENKAKLVQTLTGTVPAAANGEKGTIWVAPAPLQPLSDYLIIVKAPEGVDLDLIVAGPGDRLIGCGFTSQPGVEMVGITTESPMPVHVGVVNEGGQPANFGLSVFRIIWQ